MLNKGVYIGTDCEIAIAGNYLFTFRRNSQLNFLESRLFRREGQSFFCIGICQTSPVETEPRKPPQLWRSAFVFHGKTISMRQAFEGGIGGEIEADCEMESKIGSAVDLKSEQGNLIAAFEDGASYLTVLDEPLTDEGLTPLLPDIHSENIGECLRLWNKGMNEEYYPIDGISTFIGVTLNTSKHMYIFEMTPGSIYCRAARFVSTNQGVVFNQNFRQGVEAYMIADNRDAHLPLSYDKSNFSSGSCVWNERSVYWSLVSYTHTEITLHGCQGELYHWKKPKR
jgi:hypothetical protein